MVNQMARKNKSCSILLIAFLALQIARILEAVHAARIIHSDIKPDNFMIIRRFQFFV